MNKIFKRIMAFALAAVTAGAMGSGATAEVLQSSPEPEKLDVYCPTNEDAEFPFYMDIDVYEDTIQYIELDEPIYGLERLLDEEVLEFDVNFSLKDEYKSFDNYTFTVFNADYSEKLASKHLESGEVVNLTGLSTGDGYKISMTLESDTLNAYYGGQFTIQAELDGTLAVDLFYMLAGMDGEAAPYVYENPEGEPKNNNKQTPDIINHLGIKAYTQKDDVDYFKYDIPGWVADDGEQEYDKGVATVELTITTTGGSIPGFTVNIFDRYGNKIISNTPSGYSENAIYYTIPNVSLDDYVLIEITSLSTIPAEYTLHPNVKFGHAWFSQYVSKDENVVYWNVNGLYDIIANGKYHLFDEGKMGKDDHVFSTGCGIVSSAMIFRNLGKTMYGYDIRTGKWGNLQADPYTALLSNCNLNGSTVEKDKFPELSKDGYADEEDVKYPEALYRSMIGKSFGLTYKSIDDKSESSLRKAIAEHGYVLIYFDKGTNKQHFMVLTELAFDNTKTFAQKATVYDPAAKTYAAGAGVLLSNTNSNHSSATINNISWAGYFA